MASVCLNNGLFNINILTDETVQFICMHLWKIDVCHFRNYLTCVTLGIENAFGNLEFNLSLWK